MKPVIRSLLTAATCTALWSGTARAEITEAFYDTPTDRYAHGILGDEIEWGTLVMKTHEGRELRLTLPESRVFEDTEPRLADVDGDGKPEVLVVETDLSRGARLSVYGIEGLIGATPFIGTPNRWLAPIGAIDLDGDGVIEIAYVDRPHLAKELMIWRFVDGALELAARAPGLTNHRIGSPVIEGGIAQCDTGPVMVLADGDWREVMHVTFAGGVLRSRPAGLYKEAGSLDLAAAC
ncbi:FG-GAP repeat domain-containing protein [Profundibacterium mesophilum]|uniref:VCBS repeat-containing protein n=1 Tax=Profundibacterium mesophilum KAUST100406-0324 TaxID=1037889 RepID=A0A921NZ21_9RHOB|nr:VCBS repeat-containing protein [Profundibacterium mesophilum]KAF0676133.1 hypothetical protein PMES_01452 [Profundibacterium mesophilum KAUST100406-0324]